MSAVERCCSGQHWQCWCNGGMLQALAMAIMPMAVMPRPFPSWRVAGSHHGKRSCSGRCPQLPVTGTKACQEEARPSAVGCLTSAFESAPMIRLSLLLVRAWCINVSVCLPSFSLPAEQEELCMPARSLSSLPATHFFNACYQLFGFCIDSGSSYYITQNLK